MKKLITILCALLLIAVPALADLPLPEMATEDLIALRDAISQELASRSASADALAVWEFDEGRVELLSIQRGVDREGTPSFSLVFSFTNLTSETSSYNHSVQDHIFQDGYECSWTFVNGSDGMLASTKVLPGGTFKNIIRGYKMNADTPDITIELNRGRYPYDSLGLRTVALPAE